MLAYPNVKINLGLSVMRRRDDGYHDLETLFVPYEGLSDVLEIEASDSFRFEHSANVTWDNDLTVRAYRLLQEEYGLPPVRIRLTKRAPVGAGLGSGSSDAAFTLKMLDSLFCLHIGERGLAEYASRLGSDCPFFIYNRPMFGEGRGEILTPYDIDLSGYEIRLAWPDGVSVSTREAYGNVVPRALRREAQPSLREVLAGGPASWRAALRNDFEPSVFALHPEIAALKESFYEAGAVYASMSGSGSAVFGLFRSVPETRYLQKNEI